MFRPIARFGLLAVLAVVALATPADAFGRRQAGSDCWTPICYCPCPPPVVIPTGIDCVENRTTETLRIHISSGFGHVDAVVPPGYRFFFLFRKDNLKNRVVTAFTLDNDLVANFDFPPLDQTTLPHPICLWVTGTKAAPMRATPVREKAGGHDHGGSIPTPTNSPI